MTEIAKKGQKMRKKTKSTEKQIKAKKAKKGKMVENGRKFQKSSTNVKQ